MLRCSVALCSPYLGLLASEITSRFFWNCLHVKAARGYLKCFSSCVGIFGGCYWRWFYCTFVILPWCTQAWCLEKGFRWPLYWSDTSDRLGNCVALHCQLARAAYVKQAYKALPASTVGEGWPKILFKAPEDLCKHCDIGEQPVWASLRWPCKRAKQHWDLPEGCRRLSKRRWALTDREMSRSRV